MCHEYRTGEVDYVLKDECDEMTVVVVMIERMMMTTREGGACAT